ncbi:CopG family transcriptional regulator [Pseudomonas ogarae]|uniref:CopG family transcriptional regulator n=1 Tax=Pseudomonas ogarae (strain DSM 112162 / CECT 30235 / F113) TaxID=1114970 RepID=UPI001648A05B|nr:CopG family transcriptional regulator [Pseudomonas zarinae]QXH95305.1 CopG family transcriptional regulator [Pseudomonas zarinae]
MAEISLILPEYLSNSLTDLPRPNGLGDAIPRDCSEYERALIAQIEMVVGEADQGKSVSDNLVAEIRAQRWGNMT